MAEIIDTDFCAQSDDDSLVMCVIAMSIFMQYCGADLFKSFEIEEIWQSILHYIKQSSDIPIPIITRYCQSMMDATLAIRQAREYSDDEEE